MLYSTNADADRAFFRDVLAYPSVDAGHGWLIFALPPAELAIHPADVNGAHELFLMCDDVQAFIAQMAERDIACSEVSRERWGLITVSRSQAVGRCGCMSPHILRRSTSTNQRIGGLLRRWNGEFDFWRSITRGRRDDRSVPQGILPRDIWLSLKVLCIGPRRADIRR